MKRRAIELFERIGLTDFAIPRHTGAVSPLPDAQREPLLFSAPLGGAGVPMTFALTLNYTPTSHENKCTLR